MYALHPLPVSPAAAAAAAAGLLLRLLLLLLQMVAAGAGTGFCSVARPGPCWLTLYPLQVSVRLCVCVGGG